MPASHYMPAVITFIYRKRIYRHKFACIVQLVDIRTPLANIAVHIAYSPVIGVIFKRSNILNPPKRIDIGFIAVNLTAV